MYCVMLMLWLTNFSPLALVFWDISLHQVTDYSITDTVRQLLGLKKTLDDWLPHESGTGQNMQSTIIRPCDSFHHLLTDLETECPLPKGQKERFEHGQSFRAIRVTDIGQLPYSSILMFLSSTISSYLLLRHELVKQNVCESQSNGQAIYQTKSETKAFLIINVSPACLKIHLSLKWTSNKSWIKCSNISL